MTKTELIAATADHLGLKRVDVKRIMETMCATIQQQVVNNDPVNLPGFGKFLVQHRKARMGRNPQTGKPMKIAAKKKLVFRPAKAWKDQA